MIKSWIAKICAPLPEDRGVEFEQKSFEKFLLGYNNLLF